MVDSAINNRLSSMDVRLDSQTQLVSRIGLALKSQSQLSFLHGESGVGKSHIVNLLQESLPNVYVAKLQLKSAIEPEQLKQQIVCELATGELSDLNQPISAAVQNSILHNQTSVLLIIDNSDLLPQQTLSALWQSLHEVMRMNQTNFTFNVLLVGSSRWAIPLHHGLNNKKNSLVAEFQVNVLTQQQAIDFMMAVHADWSDIKIEQFVKKVRPNYLTPKQLVYAQMPAVKKYKQMVLICIISLFVVILGGVIIASLFLESTDNVLTQEAPSIVNNSNIAQPTLVSKPVELPRNDRVNASDKPQSGSEEKVDEASIVEEAPDHEVADNLVEEVVSVESEELTTELAIEALKENIDNETITISEPENENSSVIDTQLPEPTKTPYKFNEQEFLGLPSTSYTLMLGGYSKQDTLTFMRKKLIEQTNVKVYQTIRQQKPWFVLSYGAFDSIAQANLFMAKNAALFVGFSPWAKPIRNVHQEINIADAATDKIKDTDE